MNSEKHPPKAKVNEAREIFRGKNFAFEVQDVTLPNGGRAEFAMVRHPGSTGIVPIMDDGTVLMTFQYRHAVGEYLLEIPAGTMEAGESPFDCAKRELEEETGFAAGELIKIATVDILPAYSDEKIHVYLARNLTPSRQNLDQDEIIQVVKYPFNELIVFIAEGKITDALTILSLYRVYTYLQNSATPR
jgi:ADP-ribose pyrophosphatase